MDIFLHQTLLHTWIGIFVTLFNNEEVGEENSDGWHEEWKGVVGENVPPEILHVEGDGVREDDGAHPIEYQDRGAGL